MASLHQRCEGRRVRLTGAETRWINRWRLCVPVKDEKARAVAAVDWRHMRRFYPPTESDIYHRTTAGKVYEDVHRERIRAHDKHDDHGQSMERKSWDDPAWLSVLVEEVGEVARELCEQRHDVDRAARQESMHIAGLDRAMELTFMARLREELVQVAAMACAWIDACDQERA